MMPDPALWRASVGKLSAQCKVKAPDSSEFPAPPPQPITRPKRPEENTWRRPARADMRLDRAVPFPRNWGRNVGETDVSPGVPKASHLPSRRHFRNPKPHHVVGAVLDLPEMALECSLRSGSAGVCRGDRWDASNPLFERRMCRDLTAAGPRIADVRGNTSRSTIMAALEKNVGLMAPCEMRPIRPREKNGRKIESHVLVPPDHSLPPGQAPPPHVRTRPTHFTYLLFPLAPCPPSSEKSLAFGTPTAFKPRGPVLSAGTESPLEMTLGGGEISRLLRPCGPCHVEKTTLS